MPPTDEELLHAFYAGDTDALERLDERHYLLLWEVAFLILQARTGSTVQALNECSSPRAGITVLVDSISALRYLAAWKDGEIVFPGGYQLQARRASGE